MKRMLIGIVVLLMAIGTVQADVHTWTGQTGYFHDSGNWRGESVPDNTGNDEVYFPAGNYTVFITRPVNVYYLNCGEQVVLMSRSDVKVWTIFTGNYTQESGSFWVEHIVDSFIAIQSGIISIRNVNSSDIFLDSDVTIRNLANFPGDLDGDGFVNLSDLAILAADWLK